MTTTAPEPGALGARILHLRQRAKMSKADLARRVGVSDVSIGYWETGTIKQVGHGRLLALAGALGTSVSELLDDPMTGWTHVADELPPGNGEYDAWLAEPIKHGRRLVLYTFFRGDWLAIDGAVWPDMPRPTHWRHRPLPPMGEES